MTVNRRKLLKSTALGLIAAHYPLTRALAQAPAKSVSIVVPWPAGGPADINARRLQAELSQVSGMPVVVENIAGAGGVIGLNRYINRSQPQRGMVLVSVSDVITSLLATPGQKSKPEDFQLVGLTAIGGMVVLARESLPVQSFDELIQFGRSRPLQTLKFAHFGQGSFNHLINEDLLARTGITALQVPYKGTPEALRDLSNGDIDVVVVPLNALAVDFPHVRSLAQTSAVRNPYFANLPTVAESNTAAGYKMEGWFALAVGRDTPSAEVEQFQRWVHAAVATDTAAKTYKSLRSVVPPALSRAELDQFFKADIERLRLQLKRLGLLAAAA